MFFDSLNIDFELPVGAGSDQAAGLTAFVREAAAAFRPKYPHGHLSFDVAWSPRGIDGRFYNYTAIADLVDFIFVMQVCQPVGAAAVKM